MTTTMRDTASDLHAVAVGDYVTMAGLGFLRLSALPQLPEDFVEVLANLSDGLPVRVGLVVDAVTGRRRVLQIPDDLVGHLREVIGVSGHIHQPLTEPGAQVDEGTGDEAVEQRHSSVKGSVVLVIPLSHL